MFVYFRLLAHSFELREVKNFISADFWLFIYYFTFIRVCSTDVCCTSVNFVTDNDCFSAFEML